MTQAAIHNAFAARVAALYPSRVPATCSISRLTETDDGGGGWSQSFSTVLAGIPCRFRATAGDEIQIGGAAQAYADGVLYLPGRFNGIALDVRAKDRIVIGAWGIEPERTLEVVSFGPYEGVQIAAVVIFVQI
jgi:hypothetical protein